MNIKRAVMQTSRHWGQQKLHGRGQTPQRLTKLKVIILLSFGQINTLVVQL